jgi:AcrR family transcriptional regulator
VSRRGSHLNEPARARRRYDGTLRRQQAAETRERIVAAGSEILHASSIHDWRGLTVRSVAERAGVNERTVYRHFVNERGLRDAVMQRLEQEAGIDLGALRLEDVGDVAARIFEHVSSYPIKRRSPIDPTLSAAGRRQRTALLEAVAARTKGWSEPDRVVAAAMFDVLWSVASYERLAVDWQLDREQAIRGITWVIELLERALAERRRPGTLRRRFSAGSGRSSADRRRRAPAAPSPRNGRRTA